MCYDNEDGAADYWDGAHASPVGLVNHILENDLGLYGNYIFMQSTGRVDVNGKEIFDGDILKSLGSSRYVKEGDIDAVSRGPNGWIFIKNPELCVVVGNIYQNADLLMNRCCGSIE